MALQIGLSDSDNMSRETVTSNNIALSPSNENIPVERYRIKIRTRENRQALARFIKPQTRTSSIEDKTVVVLSPAPSSSVDLTQNPTLSNNDASNDSGNAIPTTTISDLAPETLNSYVSSATSSVKNDEITAVNSPNESSTLSRSSNLSDKVQASLPLYSRSLLNSQIKITPPSNVSSEHRRPCGRPPSFAPAIRPASESPHRRSSGSQQDSNPNTLKTHRPSWASFWSAKYHEKNGPLNSVNINRQPRASRESLPISETRSDPHLGRFDPNNPSEAIGPNSDQDFRKLTRKFSRFCRRLIGRPDNKSAQAATTSKLWDTVYDGSDPYNLLENSDDDEYNPFALNLPAHLSKDKSEMDHLRRTQEEVCLEWNKRRLFCTKGNPTRYVIEPINIYY